MSKQSLVRIVVRVVVTAVLLVFLVRHIGVEQIASSVASTDSIYLAVALLLLLVDSLIRSASWRFVLTAKQIRLRFAHVLYSYLVGGFFGSFVPSSLGPDLARTALLARRQVLRMEHVLASVVVLNLLGLWALCVLAMAGALWWTGSSSGAPAFLVIALSASAVFALVLPLLIGLLPRIPEWRTIQTPVLGRVQSFVTALRTFADGRKQLAAAVVAAFGNQTLTVLLTYVLASALQLDLSVLHLVLVLPVILLARLLPFSVAGFGAEQGIFVLLFHLVGVAAADAFALSVLLSGMGLVFLVLCGVLHLVVSIVHPWRAQGWRAGPVV